jgi:hypothetical protein
MIEDMMKGAMGSGLQSCKIERLRRGSEDCVQMCSGSGTLDTR